MNPTNRPITDILEGKEVQEGLQRGVDLIEMAVGTTLGARGRAVGIDKQYDKVIIRDGVSVAKALFPKDRIEAFAVAVIREAAQKVVENVGDGTSVSVILAHALYAEARKIIATGVHPRAIFDEIETDIKKAVELLEKQAIPIKTPEQIIDVATVSCEEKSLGKLIGETIYKIGEEGVISIDKSRSGETHVDMQSGMQWDRGYASFYFQTNPDTKTALIEDGFVMVTDQEITNMTALMPLIGSFLTKGRFLTIIAPDFGGDALTSLIANKLENKFMALCIKAPAFGGHQTNMLQDIAILTGATFITKEQGHKLEDVNVSHFGKAGKIEASQTMTTLSGGTGKKEQIDARVAEIKKLIKDETNDFELERLRERLAKMTKGVAVIKVGGATDIEIKERFERALDASLATRQAVKKGIVAGGEIVYLPLIKEMKSRLVQKALEAPFRRLVTNAGLDAGEKLALLLLDYQDNWGLDVIDNKFKDMVKAGIVDPVAAPIAALTNAMSVALQLLSTQVLVLPEDIEIKK